MTSRALFASPDGLLSLLKEGNLRITVIGLGRIGLPTAAEFAMAGANVVGVDINPEVVKTIGEGRCHFVDEPGLEEAVAQVVKDGKLTATLDYETVSSADVVVVSVPTPVDESKVPDYSAVKMVSRAIGSSLQKGTIVIVESTVGPGTVEDTVQPILEDRSGLKAGVDFGLASCPERSDPGSILKNMSSVPRIVGAVNPECTDIVAALYQAAFHVDVVKVSDPKTANAVKLTENLFRDVNIALANEFALLFEKLGIDTIEVIDACATKYNFMPHYPGSGVGGPCLPSNPYYLISEGVKVGNIPYLIRMAREINDRMPDHVVELAMEALNEVGRTVNGSKIAILGISYKPDVKDVQLSPMQRVCERLKGMGAEIAIYDPFYVGETVFSFVGKSTLSAALEGANCIVIGTAHAEFKHLDLDAIKRSVAPAAAIVDSRNVLRPAAVKEAGLKYRGVGRA